MIFTTSDMSTRVAFFNRKPRPAGNFSIENLFRQVVEHLPTSEFEPVWHVSPYFSNGLRRRFSNVLDARRHRAALNHVTGDTHYLALGLPGNRTVLTICDCVFLRHGNPFYRELLRRFWLEYPVRRAAAVTVISTATRDEVLAHCHRPSEEKVRVIPCCISDRFSPLARPFDQEEPTILQLGTAPNKNVPRVIEAIDGLDCRLILIGKMRPEIESALASTHVECEHREAVSDEEILRLYQQCDIVSLPSTLEGFGLPIVEGNAVGRPVLTSNCSSMPEVAEDAAHLVDPCDTAGIRAGFQRLIHDDSYRQALIDRGFRNRERFRPAAIAAQYADVYREVLSASRG